MLAEMLHHPPHHQRHAVLHQALLLQLKQGRSEQLGVLEHPLSQYGYLDHILHIFFNLHCCLVVLEGKKSREQQSAADTEATEVNAGASSQTARRHLSWRRDASSAP